MTMPFRAFAAVCQPTLEATTEDGTVLQAVPCVLHLLRWTPVPVYVPATEARAMIDAYENLEWHVVGDYDDILRPVYHNGVLTLLSRGRHMPETVKREFQEWANEYVRTHAKTPIIPRTEIAYQRNSYTTTHTCLFTYEQLETYTNDRLRKHHR